MNLNTIKNNFNVYGNTGINNNNINDGSSIQLSSNYEQDKSLILNKIDKRKTTII